MLHNFAGSLTLTLNLKHDYPEPSPQETARSGEIGLQVRQLGGDLRLEILQAGGHLSTVQR